jgi:hypothetical protein
MILKTIFAKIFGEKLALLNKNISSLSKDIILALVFK